MNLWRFICRKTATWLQSDATPENIWKLWLLMSPCVPHKCSQRIGSCHILPCMVWPGTLVTHFLVTPFSPRSKNQETSMRFGTIDNPQPWVFQYAWCIVQYPTSLFNLLVEKSWLLAVWHPACHPSSPIRLVGWDPKRRDRMDVGPDFESATTLNSLSICYTSNFLFKNMAWYLPDTCFQMNAFCMGGNVKICLVHVCWVVLSHFNSSALQPPFRRHSSTDIIPLCRGLCKNNRRHILNLKMG